MRSISIHDVGRTATPFLVLLSFALQSACTLDPLRSDHDVAEEIGHSVGLVEQLRQADSFLLTTRERIGRLGGDVTIYLEGDGVAWITRAQLSHDPTPDNPIALRLAALDPAENVAWIARPCQYTSMTRNPECNATYWSSGRFAPKVVASIDAAVSSIKSEAGARRIHLVGYSGGGGLAVLIAARREDVESIRTLAGNLDHRAFTLHHHVSPMDGSLNPADAAESIRAIPQLHLIGAGDTVVPELIGRSYLARMTDTRCARLRQVGGVAHNQGWEAVWKTEVSKIPAC